MSRPIGIGHNGGPPLDDYEDEDTSALYAQFEGKSVQDILREGQKALFIDLVVAVRSGKASHNEKAILRNLLKDNGLVLGIPPDEPLTRNAPVDLPDFDVPDYE
nr:hypothetical protein [uncultured Gellertiella sp.]